jgi:hypothetical protein
VGMVRLALKVHPKSGRLIDELSRIAAHMMMICSSPGPLSPY